MSLTLGEVDEFHLWEAATKTPAQLRLKTGETWTGWNFGADVSAAGEVVFATGMVGYPESLTDPSFAGQILVMTFPLIGNYGVPSDEADEYGLPKHFEGAKIYPVAVVVSDYSFAASHFAATRTLSTWLSEHKVPGIFGVDTRAITKILRERGSALGAVVVGKNATAPAWDDPNLRNLVAEVSLSSPKSFDPPEDVEGNPVRILAVDCGMKYNIIRFFIHYLKVKLTVVPWDYDFTKEEFDGLFISNGPGNPEQCEKTIAHIRTVMQERPNLPISASAWGTSCWPSPQERAPTR